MAITIYKYILPRHTTSGIPIQMPVGASILTVQMQNNEVTVWAEVNKDVGLTYRRFHIIGTGWDIDDRHKLLYVGTVQEFNYVWHIYVEMENL